MELEQDFVFRPLPPIEEPQARLMAVADVSPLGDLEALLGRWSGPGFNTIWRPFFSPGQGHFLELNLTHEILEFTEIQGAIPNRGLLQPDIEMFGVTYLQQIKDSNNGAGLHIEPGIWATVPATSDPLVDPTVVRMASIPHGTTMVAQGVTIPPVAGGPFIVPVDITAFQIGSPTRKVKLPETNLSIPTPFRSPPGDLVGVTQAMVDNPNSVLTDAIAGQTITRTVVLDVSSSTQIAGGGTSNTAFLQGVNARPNAVASLVTSTFWIETVEENGESFLQLQYTQTVLLDFAGLSWPHVTVGTLRKEPV